MLSLGIYGVDGNASTDGFARVDNVYLEVNSIPASVPIVPEPVSTLPIALLTFGAFIRRRRR
jgi:hypothetical protein